MAEAEGWSEDQRAAYDQLVVPWMQRLFASMIHASHEVFLRAASEAQCQRLEESFKSLDQTAEMLQQGTEEAREFIAVHQSAAVPPATAAQAVAAPGATSAIEALKAALSGKVDDPELRLGRNKVVATAGIRMQCHSLGTNTDVQARSLGCCPEAPGQL